MSQLSRAAATRLLFPLSAQTCRGTAANVVVALLFLHSAAHSPAAEASGLATPPNYTLRWNTNLNGMNLVTLEVTGLSPASLQTLQRANWDAAQWQGLLSVYAEPGDLSPKIILPPMLGAYRVQTGALRFEPQFPLDAGITYRAVFRPSRLPGEFNAGSAPISAAFRTPPRRSDLPTVVRRVYPGADVLPENLLKFYVHFSAPMSRGRIYDYIHLRNESGKDVELPFLEIDEELWDPTMTRITLFIDPGRIKRGVRPLEEVGPALETGKRYSLLIDREWKDGSGNALRDSFRKTFTVGPPDRQPPDPKRWKIHPPKPGTRGVLAIAFEKAMDHALAQRVIQVTGESGERVDGQTVLENQERRWTFIPLQAWHRGTYRVVVQTTLEDLAGNNIGKPFEVDLFEGVQRQITNPSVKLPFEVR